MYSNAEFVGRPETGLRYARPNETQTGPVLDHYTGVGEVMAIQSLSEVFWRLNRRFVVKRSRLLNWDDTRERDLIFIGSPSENLSLRDLPIAEDFKFEPMLAGPRKGDLAIMNLHPHSGEQSAWLASKELPITKDYALAVVSRGPAPNQSLLLLAGTTTFGTQAAVEFVSGESGAAQILLQLGGAKVEPFAVCSKWASWAGFP